MKYEKIIKWVLAILFVVGVALSVYGFIVGWPTDDQKWDTSLHFPVDLILWGAYAQKKGAFIDRNKHLVLASAHPSPLSAYNGFFGCRHFSKANAILEASGQTAIDWNVY